MWTTAQAAETLRNDPDPYNRCAAVGHLAHANHTPESLALLLEAMSDGGSYEVPEPGAPSFIHSVSEKARTALENWGPEAFEPLVAAMRASARAAAEGVWLLPGYGEPGLDILSEMLRHGDNNVVNQAVEAACQILREDGLRGVPDLVTALFPALLHQDAHIRNSSSSSLSHFFEAHRELDPKSFIVPEFLTELAAGIAELRILPEVGKLFSDDPRVLEGWVEWACHGHERGAWLLTNQQQRLDSDHISKLARGKLSPALITLLGKLGPRAAEAVPALLKTRNDPALEATVAVALLQIPTSKEAEPKEDRLDDLFFEQESVRGGILANHPNPEGLAQHLIPRLIEQWNTTADRKALRGMEALGPLMKPAMSWLLDQLQLYPSKPHARSYALCILATFGQDARPAFVKLAALLDITDARGPVLDVLTKLGPVAADPFLPILEALEMESRTWRTWKKNWWREPVLAALRSVRGKVEG